MDLGARQLSWCGVRGMEMYPVALLSGAVIANGTLPNTEGGR
jgi:hypothetical protein